MKIIRKNKYPPGDFGIWIIIYVEFVTFAGLFLGYAFARRMDVELFNSSQLLLNQTSGFINTLLLITASFFVVQSIHVVKNFENKKADIIASRWLLAAMAMGFIFMIIKVLELSNKFSQGIDLSTNIFFMFYFILTIFHFMHVGLGLVILFTMYRKTKAGGYSIQEHRGLETGAAYWHMVDLLWIILFPLVYIIR